MGVPRNFPAFAERDYRDYENGHGHVDPFARCEHALDALRAGDAATALTTLAQRDARGGLADRIGGEAESLIRAGLLADAERRLECAVSPKFSSDNAARDAYEAHRAAEPKFEQLPLSLECAA
ncbi:hypothetical protein ABIE45_004560 [Methylobacterium sp. OAE515]|uniref:hypothetical protein n=1 Tax=Methylobacterium sp. OAE515 TaxID=2817895 RepID=UPI00178985CB